MAENNLVLFCAVLRLMFPLSLKGEKSGWNSCNNSAVNSNRLSPVSASELPDSPTQYAASKNKENLSGQTSEGVSGPTESSYEGDGADLPSDSTEKVLQTASRLDSWYLSDEKSSSNAFSGKAMDVEESKEFFLSAGVYVTQVFIVLLYFLANLFVPLGSRSQQSSVNDEDDYGSFNGTADSELLNQSIEAVMPKRFLVYEIFQSIFSV